MMEFLSISEYFGIALTLVGFCLALWLNKKWPSPFTTPLLIAIVLVIVVLLLFQIPYSVYSHSAKYITYLLVPATVCFAVPMYKQLPLLKKHGVEILLSVLVGVVSAILSVIIICALFGVGDIIVRSLVSISVTTAFAVGVTSGLGGIVALTVPMVVITGVLGAAVGGTVCKVLNLQNPIARGLAIGNASHSAGTTRAMQMGQIEGAMSSLAIVLAGILTAIIAPLMIYIFY